jgi:hypothetical protein
MKRKGKREKGIKRIQNNEKRKEKGGKTTVCYKEYAVTKIKIKSRMNI